MSGAGDMSDKDPGIMLFGMKIPLPECQIPATSQMGCQIQANSATMNACSSPQKTEVETLCGQNSEQPKNTSDLRDSKQETQNNEQENEPKANPKPVEDNRETSSTDQDKSFKKPDKILHCPRCNSLDTKFCYFNNYNVNQPRHFCKNCQRYWTAGGTMRNVPVGAGRRKNKHLASQYRHIIVASDGIPTTRLETQDSSVHQLVSTLESAAFRSSTDNGTLLKFGPDVPLCESMESILNLRDHKRSVDASSVNCAENGEEEPSLCASSLTNACTTGNELLERDTSRSSQCYPVPPWVFPWNPGWNNVGPMVAAHQSSLRMCDPYSTDPAALQWCPQPLVAVPTICPPSVPLQFVPGSYWSGTPVWPAGTGAVSMASDSCLSPSSLTSNSCCSGNGSPTLGKHTRDTVFIVEEKSDMRVLAPKTLRIDDPSEASKSPIWATSGIKLDKHLSESENGILKKVEPKGEAKDRVLVVSPILEANPAAISRAHAFQESI